MHRAVILLGLLLAAFGALLGALGSSPVAAASIVIAGALVVIAGLWLRRRSRAAEPLPIDDVETAGPSIDAGNQPSVDASIQPSVDADNQPSESLRLWPADANAAIATAPAPGPTPAIPAQEGEPREQPTTREAELAREAELNAIADELRALRSRDLSSIHIPEWKARIETWVDVDLKARADRGEEVPPQAAEWMRDFGEIPVKDWRRHLLRHLRRLGYRNYREGEW
ncbi:MAG: hypothetical protein WEF51_05855 [Chloroflexota bacterium]